MNATREPQKRTKKKQAQSYQAEYFMDSVGRRRKLSHGAMVAIRADFARGASTRELAERYGVSTHLILTVCYSTPRNSDLPGHES